MSQIGDAVVGWRMWREWSWECDRGEMRNGRRAVFRCIVEAKSYCGQCPPYLLLPTVIIPDAAIGHSSIAKSTVSKVGFNSPSQISIVQIDTTQISSSQVDFSQIGSSQIGKTQPSSLQISPFEVSLFQISLFQTGFNQSSIAEVRFIEKMVREISSTEVRPSEIGSFQGTSIEVRVTQVNPLQISSNQIASYLNSPKFSLPSSITLQQFLSSHNFNLQNTTVSTWSAFLQGQIPFNLNLSIQDLPAGQLAEAQITNFNSNGTPTAATLLLDTDANGIGWFIDNTPWENSEFTTLTTESVYKSTPGSAA